MNHSSGYNLLFKKFEKLPHIKCFRDEPLSLHSSWKIGGPARILVKPENTQEIITVLGIARRCNVDILVIGDGSNLLFNDKGVECLVLKIGKAISNVRIDGETLWAQAGISAPRLAREALAEELGGIEHIVGIPGRLGGLIAMNGGSLRKNIGQAVEWVKVITLEGQEKQFSALECDFGYRQSRFQKASDVIVEVKFRLRKRNVVDIHREMLEILRERRNKFPLKYPNCGSVFLSDPEIYEQFGPPGKIIQEAGCKGLTVGGAQVSEKHANFILNRGNAKAEDVINIIKVVRDKVYNLTGCLLPCEVKYVSPHGIIQPLDILEGQQLDE